jgi:alpha-tubulin suppressor-like RCC1 family protein
MGTMRRRTLGTVVVASAVLSLPLLLPLVLAACGSLLGVDGPYHAETDAATTTGDALSGEGAAHDAPSVDAGGDAPVADGPEGGPITDAGPIEAGPIVGLSAGRSTTCARYAGGVAKCWGLNTDGQFGNGTVVNSSVPVSAMGSGIAGLFQGFGNTCAALAGAGACTGRGGEGQLLDGQLDAQSYVPVPTTALPAAPSAFASAQHTTCAIVAGGDVYCAGDGTLGELGNGSTSSSAVPVKVDLGGAAAKVISGTWHHMCALTVAGAVYCWGDDTSGQLGNGSFNDAGTATPVHVTLAAAASEIGAGDANTCAIVGPDGNNSVWCWGDNSFGQLGNGGGGPSAVPVQVSGLTGLANLAVGAEHACVGLSNAGGIACWGKGGSGELGNNGNADSPTPVDVSNVGGAPAALVSGGFHTCALVSSPNVICWGSNDFGQLGNDDPLNNQQNAPVAVHF